MKSIIKKIILILHINPFIYAQEKGEAKTCDSKIYCDGPVLKAVQLNQIFPDGKTFVDMATKKSESEVLKEFEKLGDNPSKQVLKSFVDVNFHDAGYELVQVNMTDFKTDPKFLEGIQDNTLKAYAKIVHSYWNDLVRKIDLNKICKECVSTYLPTKNAFVVPGGRFREFYYWDSYFALQGLLLGELYDTSKNMLSNFLDFVDLYGFMPNGARIYFLNRSQPPLLTPMIHDYFEKTNDVEFLKRAIDTLDKEYKYWIDKHSARVPCISKAHCYLTRYYVHTNLPRPESFREDYITVEHSNFTLSQKQDLYADLATGAESGWDYSTRWLSQDEFNGKETNEEILRRLKTRQVIPVDLNSIMYLNEKLLAKLHLKLSKLNSKCSTKHSKLNKFYEDASKVRAQLMYDIMFDKKDSIFYDFNVTSSTQIKNYAASNYWPFWTGALSDDLTKGDVLYNSFDKVNELNQKYPGGIPSTLIPSSLQWDLPNSWPPLEYVLIFGLKNTNTVANKKYPKLSLDIANKFVKSVFCAWYQTGGEIPEILAKDPKAPKDQQGHMFEKFNVTAVGRSGGGGEYQVQTGFGWTNGVLLSVLNLFSKELKAPSIQECKV